MRCIRRCEIYASNNAGVLNGQGMNKKTIQLNYVTPADGYVNMAMRANAASTLTTTRYFYAAGMVDITLPPTA